MALFFKQVVMVKAIERFVSSNLALITAVIGASPELLLQITDDGNLFIFANRDSILFNYRLNRVVKTFPRIP
ncbi:hypothetical protein IFM89_009692 [Coptis chinensis]|uniref:Glyoxal oxidase N-terminal domain-containing protein n=1 Tax=Coptis chinensis TaxID=261450 RepID=A0A835IJ55_9MAGN|nr:hypothetical protein IFM89_009692 [Coptis chinensis]